jgi:hypothetical protein
MSNEKHIGQLGWSVAAAVAATLASHMVVRWLAMHTDLGDSDDNDNPDPSTSDNASSSTDSGSEPTPQPQTE